MSGFSRYKDRRAERARVIDLAEAVAILGDATPEVDFANEFPPQVVEATRRSDLGFGDHRRRAIRIPLSTAVRDLNTGAPTAGGNLSGQGQLTMLNALRGASAVLESGVNLIDVPPGPAPGIPEVSRHFDQFGTSGTDDLEGFVAEGGAVYQDELEFALSAAVFKTVGGTVKITRKLANLGGPAAMTLIQRELLNMIAGRLDYALLGGRNTLNEPAGLRSLSGVQEIDLNAGYLGWQEIRNAVLTVVGAGARDDRLAWVGSPATQYKLSRRPVTGETPESLTTPDLVLQGRLGSVVWGEGKIDGRPAIATRNAGSLPLAVGDFSNAYVLLQDGVTLIVDPRSDATGAYRVTVLADVAVVIARKSAFCRLIDFV